MSNFDMYQNTGYSNNRNRKRTLILDIDDSAASDTHLGSGTGFNIKLFEPLIIDKHSEVYLDNFLTFNSNVASTISEAAFCLKINEFNMNSNVASSSNNNTVFNSLVIPNDHKSVSGNHGAVVHKGKKFNYVCDINPQTIHNISGKITDLSGSPMFHGSGAGQFTYTIVGIDSGNLSRLILKGEKFAGISTIGAGGGVITSSVGNFITTHFKNSTELHFVTDFDIGDITAGGSTNNITFTGVTLSDGTAAASTTIVLSNAAATNPNLHLLENPARFIAEFSIVSVSV
jgi:hypothetical protein